MLEEHTEFDQEIHFGKVFHADILRKKVQRARIQTLPRFENFLFLQTSRVTERTQYIKHNVMYLACENVPDWQTRMHTGKINMSEYHSSSRNNENLTNNLYTAAIQQVLSFAENSTRKTLLNCSQTLRS